MLVDREHAVRAQASAQRCSHRTAAGPASTRSASGKIIEPSDVYCGRDAEALEAVGLSE